MKEDTFPTRLVAPEPKSTIALVCGASRSHLWANTALISSINPPSRPDMIPAAAGRNITNGATPD